MWKFTFRLFYEYLEGLGREKSLEEHTHGISQ